MKFRSISINNHLVRYRTLLIVLTIALVAALASMYYLRQSQQDQARAYAVQEQQNVKQLADIKQQQEIAEVERVKTEAIAKEAAAKQAKAKSGTNTADGTPLSMTPVQDGKTSPRPNASSKPGDLIGNNTKKKAKTYYGGPLVFSPQTVVVERGNCCTGDVKVSSPDGAAISLPSSYWDATSHAVGIGSRTSDTGGYKPSWNMVVDAMYNTQPGTYTLEVVGRTLNRVDAVEYSGKITVIVK